MRSRPALLVACLVSSIGDSLFLTGIPIYFFATSGGELKDAGYLSVLITLTVLIFRKWVVRFNLSNPLVLVGLGELTMAAMEIGILGAYTLWPSKLLVMASIVPLALCYNVYAPAKYYYLASKLYRGADVVRFAGHQSAANRMGFLIGVGCSGYVYERFGLSGLFLVDAASFAVFGAVVLLINAAQVRSDKIPKGELHPVLSNASGPTPQLGLAFASTWGLAAVSISRFFGAWEQSMSIPTVALANGMSLGAAALARGVAGAAGVALSLFVTQRLAKHSVRVWLALLTGLLCITPLAAFAFAFSASYLLFFLGGTVVALNLPAHQAIYGTLATDPERRKALVARHWIWSSPLNLTIPVIGYFADTALRAHGINPVATSLVLLLIFGSLGANGIYRGTIRGTIVDPQTR